MATLGPGCHIPVGLVGIEEDKMPLDPMMAMNFMRNMGRPDQATYGAQRNMARQQWEGDPYTQSLAALTLQRAQQEEMERQRRAQDMMRMAQYRRTGNMVGGGGARRGDHTAGGRSRQGSAAFRQARRSGHQAALQPTIGQRNPYFGGFLW